MLRVHFTQGDGAGWALDEDLRQIRESLSGIVRETGASGADVIHAPFWQNLCMVAPEILSRAFVIAHADNPPFFYVKQAEFLAGQRWVDLWVARSREALGQFRALGLEAVHIPYTIDPGLFFSIAEKREMRSEFEIPQDAYVIANFHRDTEGADLKTPKFQKAPEMMVAILRALRARGGHFHVLLAGPRRHWIRGELEREGMPFTFVGKTGIPGDDFGVNILERSRLNKLYNASDLYLIPSRWEGGPQSVMEAAASRCKILSTPLGVARDILDPVSFFRTPGEAADIILEDMRRGILDATTGPQFQRWEASHTTDVLRDGLRKLYATLDERADFRKKIQVPRPPALLSAGQQIAHTFRRRLVRSRLPRRVFWNHSAGHCPELDGILGCVRGILENRGIEISSDPGAPLEISGWRSESLSKKILQFTVPGTRAAALAGNAMLAVPSVQDILNLRAQGVRQPAVVLPFPRAIPLPQAREPYVVAPGDTLASLRVWAALAAGRAVVYPDDLAYYEQVFHAGIATKPEAPDTPIPEELAPLVRIPTEIESARVLEKILMTLNS